MPRDLTSARDQVLSRFRWIGGDADTWDMLRAPESLRSIADELARLCATDRPDVIVGIEARGFVLAPLVAASLGVGFSPVRKGEAMFPGETVSIESGADYRGHRQRLSLRRDHFGPTDRVALVDDWIETGSQALAVQQLIASTGAALVGVSVIVDEAGDGARGVLPTIRSLVSANELPE